MNMLWNNDHEHFVALLLIRLLLLLRLKSQIQALISGHADGSVAIHDDSGVYSGGLLR
jgi:hypothetical protein